MEQKERNQQTAALARLHVKVLSEFAQPLGFIVDPTFEHQIKDEPDSGFLGRFVTKGGPRREYTLMRPGVDFGEIKILGPIPGDLAEPELRQYFSDQLMQAIARDRAAS